MSGKCSADIVGPSGSVNPVRIYSKSKRLLTPKGKQKQRGCLLQKLVFESYSFNHVGFIDIFVDLTSNLKQ